MTPTMQSDAAETVARLRRARPLPPHNEMAIDDLTDEEGEAFLAAVLS